MQIFAKAHSQHEEIGHAEIEKMPQAERLKIIAVRSGILFFLAVASVFVPILHFILVPGFLLASVFAGLSASRFTEKVVSGSVPCPHCQKPLALTPMPLSWPLDYVCQGCASTVRIYDKSQKANS